MVITELGENWHNEEHIMWINGEQLCATGELMKPANPLPTSGIPPKDHPRGGRPKGSKNRRYADARAFAAKIIDDPQYFQSIRARALSGVLSPGLEALLWYYRYGKPAQRIEVDTNPDEQDFYNMSSEELVKKAKELTQAAEILSACEHKPPN